MFVRIHRSVVILAFLSILASCGVWKPERLEASTEAAIDQRLTIGMSVDAFRREFNNAVLVDGDATTGAWFVYVEQVCFWCRTPNGFQRSRDVYARVVHFDDGALARIEPARMVSRAP